MRPTASEVPPCNTLHLLSGYEFICLHFVVGLDRDIGLHRICHNRARAWCRAFIRYTNSDFVRNHGLVLEPHTSVCSN